MPLPVGDRADRRRRRQHRHALGRRTRRGSPKRRTNPVHVRRASIPVTSCSRIAGTSASKTRPLLLSRMPGSRRRVSRTTPGGSSSPVQSSSAPSNEGTASRAHCAPLPHAWVAISPAAGSAASRTVAAPIGVRHVLQCAPSRPDAMARVVASTPVRAQRGVEVERPARAVATLERQDSRGQCHDSSLEKRTEPGSRTTPGHTRTPVSSSLPEPMSARRRRRPHRAPRPRRCAHHARSRLPAPARRPR